jgi:hypothetical protein
MGRAVRGDMDDAKRRIGSWGGGGGSGSGSGNGGGSGGGVTVVWVSAPLRVSMRVRCSSE